VEGIYSRRRHLKEIGKLKNVIKLVEEFEKEIREKEIRRVQ